MSVGRTRCVDLPRAGEHDLGRRVVIAACLEQRQLGAAVDVEVVVRVAHAVDVADLAGEVEDHLAIAYQVVHRRVLPDVGDVDADLRLDAVDVEEVPAVVVDQRVDQQHIGAERRQLARQVAADEAEAAGHHDAATAIEVAVIVAHARGDPLPGRPLTGDASARTSTAPGAIPRWWTRRTTSAHHSFSTSTPVRAMRLKLKNCELPWVRW
jgi:hypothetical protein